MKLLERLASRKGVAEVGATTGNPGWKCTEKG